MAIDYSLLLVSRWREERAHGHDNHTAVVIAMSTAGHAVVASGVTVAISLLALLVVPVPDAQAPSAVAAARAVSGVRTAVVGASRNGTAVVDVLPRAETVDSDGTVVVDAVRTAVQQATGGPVGSPEPGHRAGLRHRRV